MAATNEVQVHAPDRASAEAMAARAIEEVQRIETKYSRYRPDSIVSRINAAAGHEAVAIDAETAQLLDYADACWRESGGLFDATSGVLRRAWRFEAGLRPPTESALASVLPLIGWDRVERAGATVRLPVAGMELDFGGFGKEYAVDRAALALRNAGAASALVNLAGDLAILGAQPGGEPWRLADAATRGATAWHSQRFRSPRAPSPPAATTSVSSRWTACGIAMCSIRAPAARRAASSPSPCTRRAASSPEAPRPSRCSRGARPGSRGWRSSGCRICVCFLTERWRIALAPLARVWVKAGKSEGTEKRRGHRGKAM